MADLPSIPPLLAETLGSFPSPGERNNWLYTVAVRARHCASPERVRDFLSRVVADQGWQDRDFTREIDRAVRRAFDVNRRIDVPTDTASPRAKYPPWPQVDSHLHRRALHGELLFDPSLPLNIAPADVLDGLFSEDDLLCLSADKFSASTQPRSAWRGEEAEFQFIVANPMTAQFGHTQDGDLSQRCLENATTHRTYQVVENKNYYQAIKWGSRLTVF